MSAWTTAFCDLCHAARMFAEAHRIQKMTWAKPYHIYQYDLAQARARLMLACADYRVLRDRQSQEAS